MHTTRSRFDSSATGGDMHAVAIHEKPMHSTSFFSNRGRSITSGPEEEVRTGGRRKKKRKVPSVIVRCITTSSILVLCIVYHTAREGGAICWPLLVERPCKSLFLPHEQVCSFMPSCLGAFVFCLLVRGSFFFFCLPFVPLPRNLRLTAVMLHSTPLLRD